MRWDPLQRLFLVYQGGGDPPPQQSTTTVNQLYSPEEAARRARVMAAAEGVYNQTSVQPAVGMSADTRAAQDAARKLMNTSQLPGMAQQLRDATGVGYSAMLDPTSAPGFQSTLDTALRNVQQQYMSPTGPFAGVRSAFTGGNSAGTGTREGIMMGMAGRDYLNTVGDVTGRLTSDAYGRATDLFSRTMALAPQNMAAVSTAERQPMDILGSLGQQTEAYAQQEKDAPWAALSPYASIVMGMSNPSTQTTQQVPGAQRNPMAPMGGAMMGGAMASMMGFNPLIGAGAGLLLSLFK